MAPISYKWNSSKAELSIALPDKIVFDFEFLKMTAKMLHLINKFPCEIVTFMCNNSADYDKLSKAYLYNLLLHVAGEKKAAYVPLMAKFLPYLLGKRAGAGDISGEKQL